MTRSLRLTFPGSVLAMTLAALALTGIAPARQLYRQHQRIDAEERKLEALHRENGRLDGRLAQLEDPEYVEKLAREELGLVRQGEISYVVVPGQEPAAKPAAAPRPTPWYERVWRSLLRLVGLG